MGNKIRRFIIAISLATPLLMGIGDVGVSAACAVNLQHAVHQQILIRSGGKTC